MTNFILFILNFLLIIEIQSWILEEPAEINVQIPVHKFPENIKLKPLYHEKIQFGIIVAQNSNFSISLRSKKTVKNLYFYCLDDSTTGASHKINFKGLANKTINVTADSDCVPVASVSYGVPVTMTITATKWNILPIFYSHRVDKSLINEMEQEFYKMIETYGFVEYFHTQMLLTSRDVATMKIANSSLTTTMRKHAEVVKYYIKLLGGVDYQPQSIFLRTKSIFPKDHPAHNELNHIYANQTINVNHVNINNLNHYTNCSHFNVTSDWIVTNANITELLTNSEGNLSWCTLTKIGRFYEKKYFAKDLQTVGNVWGNLLAHMYSKFVNHKKTKGFLAVKKVTLQTYYFHSVPIQEWNLLLKVNFFKNLFHYDTESTFREFNTQHIKNSYLGKFNDIVYTVVDLFLVRHNLNILGHLKRVNLTLMENTSPSRHYDDLKMRLLNVKNYVPKLFTDCRENFTVTIESQNLSVEGRCLYISGNCSLIGKVFVESETPSKVEFRTSFLKETSNYYSIYFAEKIGGKFYFSDLKHPLLIIPKFYPVEVNEIGEKRVFLPLVYYYVDVNCGSKLATRTLINYRTFTIETIFNNLNQNGFYSLTLIRNGSSIIYQVNSTRPSRKNSRIVKKIHFEINDSLIIHFENPRCKIKINDYVENFGNESIMYSLTNIGLRKVLGRGLSSDIIKRDVERINNFKDVYNKTLSSNVFFNLALDHYAHLLSNSTFRELILSGWHQTEIISSNADFAEDGTFYRLN